MKTHIHRTLIMGGIIVGIAFCLMAIYDKITTHYYRMGYDAGQTNCPFRSVNVPCTGDRITCDTALTIGELDRMLRTK